MKGRPKVLRFIEILYESGAGAFWDAHWASLDCFNCGCVHFNLLEFILVDQFAGARLYFSDDDGDLRGISWWFDVRIFHPILQLVLFVRASR